MDYGDSSVGMSNTSNMKIYNIETSRKESKTHPINLTESRLGTLSSIWVYMSDLMNDCWSTSEVMFSNRLTGLLICGPIALIGGKDGLNILGEPTCFALAGLALIPCAERLSFVTEEVATHTNETFGALLNATFGNAPELLISTAALRSGFYRVVQLTLLGSILTNLLLVFGISSFVGGLRWQVQEVRLTSGNVSVGMLLIATTGLVLPAVLKMCDEEMFTTNGQADASLMFSRFNALIMIIMYMAYLFFQLATHKDEFEDHLPNSSMPPTDSNIKEISPLARQQKRNMKNIWCNKYVDDNVLPIYTHQIQTPSPSGSVSDLESEVEMTTRQSHAFTKYNNSTIHDGTDSSSSESGQTSDESNLNQALIPNNYDDTAESSISLPERPQNNPFRRAQHPHNSPKDLSRKSDKKISRRNSLKRSKSDATISDNDLMMMLPSPSQGKLVEFFSVNVFPCPLSVETHIISVTNS